MWTLGVNYWSRGGGPRMWTRYQPQRVEEELAWARTLGISEVRWFLFWPDFEPQVGDEPSDLWQRVDHFLSVCGRYQLKTYPTLLVGHMSGQNWDPAWRNRRDLWTDPWMVEREEDFIRRSVARLAAYAEVAGWVLTNEWPLWAGPTEPEVFSAWIQRMVEAVRAADPKKRPISLGDGLWNARGQNNGIRIDRLQAWVDFVGPHVYPGGEPSWRIPYAAFAACAMARGSKPVLLEEFGTTDALGDEPARAQFFRSQLVGALAAGATGAWAWCLTDFDLPLEPPYCHHPHELRFGLLTVAGQPKMTAQVFSEFGTRASQFGQPTSDPVAVIVPAIQHGGVPLTGQADRDLMTRVADHMLIALASLGFNPLVIREPVPDPWQPQSVPEIAELTRVQAAFLVAPRVGAPLQTALWDWVANGGHLYLAYSVPNWLVDLAGQLGVTLSGPYNQHGRLNGPVGVRWPGQEALEWTGSAEAIGYATWSAGGAKPVARLDDGTPALWSFAKGRGEILATPFGWESASDPFPFLWSWYRAILDRWNVTPSVRFDRPGGQAAISQTGRVVLMNHGTSAMLATPVPPITLIDDAGEAQTQVLLPPGQWWWGTVS